VNANTQQNYGLHALFVKYESRQKMTLKCSTTVYSFGKAVVEKIQVEDPIMEYNTYAYYFNHSPMCDYMVQFIDKVRKDATIACLLFAHILLFPFSLSLFLL
jgi:hypothetical protein